MPTTYEHDYFTWTQEQAAFLQQGRFDLLDLKNLAEEVADMGKSEQRELAHRLAVLIGHLLKLQVHTDRSPTNEKSWRFTVIEQRRRLRRHLHDNPGLKNPDILKICLEDAFGDGKILAIRDTGLDPDLFPADNPYSLAQLLDPDDEP